MSLRYLKDSQTLLFAAQEPIKSHNMDVMLVINVDIDNEMIVKSSLFIHACIQQMFIDHLLFSMDWAI